MADRCYVYWWANGVYSKVCMPDRLCLLLIIGIPDARRPDVVERYRAGVKAMCGRLRPRLVVVYGRSPVMIDALDAVDRARLAPPARSEPQAGKN